MTERPASTPARPDGAPGLRIVLVNGYAGCLKTTLSYHLAPLLGLGLISNSVLGGFSFDQGRRAAAAMRERRYATAAALAETCLEAGISVILDGTYALRQWRQRIYSLAARFAVSDVLAITCTCSDPGVLEERFARRRLDPRWPDAAANHIGAFHGSVEEFEPLSEDRLPEGQRPALLGFDSGNLSVSAAEPPATFAAAAVEAIERLVARGTLSGMAASSTAARP
jgi:predicted kinase